jgi:hypothetical protein
MEDLAPRNILSSAGVQHPCREFVSRAADDAPNIVMGVFGTRLRKKVSLTLADALMAFYFTFTAHVLCSDQAIHESHARFD